MEALEKVLRTRGYLFWKEMKELEELQEKSRPFSLQDEEKERLRELKNRLEEISFVRFLIKKEKVLAK